MASDEVVPTLGTALALYLAGREGELADPPVWRNLSTFHHGKRLGIQGLSDV
jgi:hypothetical protein